MCHHAERIYCKINKSWIPQFVVSQLLENVVVTPLYHKLSATLNFLLISLFHALGQHSVTHKNYFLSHARPDQHQVQTVRIAIKSMFYLNKVVGLL